jgi:hypothetical protein
MPQKMANDIMSWFEFSFTLFGLVLGLALAEVLKGFVAVLKARSFSPDTEVSIKLGWQTPLLGLLVGLDLISFWLGAWQDREAIPIEFFPLVFAALVAGIYYAAASLVFPDDVSNWPDLDLWFDRHKAQVAAGIFAANFLFSLGEILLFGTWSAEVVGRVMQVIYLLLTVGLILSRRKWQSLTLLILLLSVFGLLAARPLIVGA